MVRLFIGGKQIGVGEDAGKVLAECLANREAVELRDAAGVVLGRAVPAQPGPLVPWDPSIDLAELERRRAEPGYTIDEVRAMLGWK